MSGNIGTIVVKVNKACDDLDFVSARGIIEANLLKLSEAKYYRLLNASGRDVLIKHILADNKGQEITKISLTRTDLLVINKIIMSIVQILIFRC
ncbi:putative protein OS=Lysinibacillus sphaericus OX=1421 GN=LS41612_07200 PE=4 SV=1 [Lysinibacillus sphaericus]